LVYRCPLAGTILSSASVKSNCCTEKTIPIKPFVGSPLQVSSQATQPSQTQSTHTLLTQQPQQQQISQQLLQQSIPQGLLHQNVAVDLQQPPLPASVPSQVCILSIAVDTLP